MGKWREAFISFIRELNSLAPDADRFGCNSHRDHVGQTS
jgi:hypothetical protein